MADTKIPLEPPPNYEDAAAQQAAPAAPMAKPLPRGPFPLDIPVLTQLRGKRVVLASASPRRKQLLGQIGLTNIEITPSTKPENLDKVGLGAFDYVLRTAQQKCLDVYQTLLANSLKSIPDPTMVIAADTVIVTVSGRILEKPRSEAEHLAMLRMLRDQVSHKVYTAVCVLVPRDDARAPGYNMESAVEETKVVFDETASDEFISAYVKTREAVGMAGGYGIQGMGGLLVERIEGAYDNVVGLPLRATLALMEKTLFMQGSDDEDEDEEE
ncbi:hypothetical protein V500_11434 [Pseudogymnoascus sp. VKM F-4518 (FW-2643)]|nr:hypothetical protein V500_11434 [Pseudogymnoascus sp. VKM F-4518 (FW-2643)]KFZ17670.1 hypothetical protein V502_04483 [Pseudogymnoascus sp. VKM F-4520 (FW-2644)]